MLLSSGRINVSNLFLKLEIDSEFLIFSSKLNQSLNVEGKKEYLKQSIRQWIIGVWLFLVLIVISDFLGKVCLSFFMTDIPLLTLEIAPSTCFLKFSFSLSIKTRCLRDSFQEGCKVHPKYP